MNTTTIILLALVAWWLFSKPAAPAPAAPKATNYAGGGTDLGFGFPPSCAALGGVGGVCPGVGLEAVDRTSWPPAPSVLSGPGAYV